MEDSRQKELLKKINLLIYATGLPYFWFEECKWPLPVIMFLKYATIVLKTLSYGFFLISGLLPLLTQTNLNDQQIYNILTYNISFPFLYLVTVTLRYHKNDVKKLIYELVVSAPSVYKDPKIEAEMVQKSKTWSISVSCIGWIGMSMLILDDVIRSLTTDDVFSPIITVWPNIQDKSQIANAFRILISVVWCLLVVQFNGSLVLVICLTIYTSHQFKQLQSLFCNLTKIFEEDLSQSKKEEKYEKALKVGFKLHKDIISYTRRLVKTYHIGYGGEIFTNVIILVIIMIRLTNQEKDLAFILTNGLVSMTMLTITWIYMSTLGDITVEADKLTNAMYMSGWENCTRSSSVRVRNLLSVGMAQTQKPLTIYALGIIVVSFSSYLSIVKCSYTIFSMMV
nr:odorant receptor 5 [Achelura yunnanensis]